MPRKTSKQEAKKLNIIVIALSPTGSGISGGDRIFIELAREWSRKHSVTIYTTSEGQQMMARQKLKGKHLDIKVVAAKLPSNSLIKYLYKIYFGIKLGLTLSKSHILKNTSFLYSASEFWMDVFPAAILKTHSDNLKWVATWYQTAPNPLKGYNEADRKNTYNFSALLYWLVQLPSKPLIKKHADKVIVNNEDERKRFPIKNIDGNVLVLIGAVPLQSIHKWLKEKHKTTKMYDAVFQGRFHPQKGVVELIDIWSNVVKKQPKAKLAMIGDGPLMKNVKNKIKENKLDNNVKLFGYVFDGPKKYEIFNQSKIVVHPAFYDSGGMASAEAMAFGIPAVGFDLKAYESYYPKGMVKVRKGDLAAFSDNILKLLEKDSSREKLGREAGNMITTNWSWRKRANKVLELISLNG